jgi:hypothetical protein
MSDVQPDPLPVGYSPKVPRRPASESKLTRCVRHLPCYGHSLSDVDRCGGTSWREFPTVRRKGPIRSQDL